VEEEVAETVEAAKEIKAASALNVYLDADAAGQLEEESARGVGVPKQVLPFMASRNKTLSASKELR
jgi:hypothetical protein